MILFFHHFFLLILEVLVSLLFITGYSKLTKLKSKRDPYFGRRVFQKGTPAWVTKNMIATAWVCVILTNFFMMIAFAFYDELVGINRGSYADQFNRVGSKLFDYINPFNWAQVLSPFPHTTPINSLAWTIFLLVSLSLAYIMFGDNGAILKMINKMSLVALNGQNRMK